jgi:chorismate-pyruvate lyase
MNNQKSTTFEQAVLPLFELNRKQWLAEARSIAFQLAITHGEVTIDMVREKCPPPKNIDGRVMGAVFASRDWQCIGYEKSVRGLCHHRPIGRFKLK